MIEAVGGRAGSTCLSFEQLPPFLHIIFGAFSLLRETWQAMSCVCVWGPVVGGEAVVLWTALGSKRVR